MRVPAVSAGLVLGTAFLAVAGLTMMAPASQTKANPPARIALTRPAPVKVKWPCDCPPHVRHVTHRVHRVVRHYARSYYNYSEAASYRQDWHETSRDSYAEQEGLTIDRYGWTGGVGYGAEGGGGGGYVFANGNQNGPTYNSYGESFQRNPSMAHPFQNRSMGGLAPRSGGR